MQVDNVKDVDVVVPMYILVEYGDNYLKTSGSQVYDITVERVMFK